jgi:hypothetical protein
MITHITNQILDKTSQIIKNYKEKAWEEKKRSLMYYDWLTEHNQTLTKGVRNERIQAALTAGKSLSNVRMSYRFDDPFDGPSMQDGFSAPNAVFTDSYWYRVTWRNGDLSKANFKGAIVRCCELKGTSFREADLRNVNFENSDLSSVDFTNAYLDEVNFQDAGYYYKYPPTGLTDKHFEQLEPWEHYAIWPIEAGNSPKQKIYQGFVTNPTKETTP